jgi:hypothetical protein
VKATKKPEGKEPSPQPSPRGRGGKQESDPPPKTDDEPLCTICGLRSCYKA